MTALCGRLLLSILIPAGLMAAQAKMERPSTLQSGALASAINTPFEGVTWIFPPTRANPHRDYPLSLMRHPDVFALRRRILQVPDRT